MKLLFFLTPHFRMSTVFQIQSEVLLKYASKGYKVFIIKLLPNEVLDSSTRYISNNSYRYIYDKFCRKLFDLLDKQGVNYEVVNFNKFEYIFTGDFSNVNELRSYSYDGQNIGLSVCSSLISTYRDHEFDTIAKRKDVIREINVAINVLKTAKDNIAKFNPDVVCFFNGRLSTNAPILGTCISNNIQYSIFEFTLRKEKYHLLENGTPHNYECRYKELLELWEAEGDLDKKNTIGRDFFEKKYKGDLTVGANFLVGQDQHSSLNIEGKKIVSFFNSSLDEFVSVPGWEEMYSVFNGEYEAIHNTCRHFQDRKDIVFVLRIHPNLSYLDNTQMRELEKLKSFQNLIIIPPTSKVYSYNIINESDLIIVFNSTIGIEACYMGKATIALAKNFYDKLDVTYMPKNEDEFYDFIENTPPPKPKENTYRYGYWWMNFGTSFKFRGNSNGYAEDYFSCSPIEQIVSVGLKLVSCSFYRTFRRTFFNKNILQRFKNPAFRNAIIRNIIPWKK